MKKHFQSTHTSHYKHIYIYTRMKSEEGKKSRPLEKQTDTLLKARGTLCHRLLELHIRTSETERSFSKRSLVKYCCWINSNG